MLGQTQPGPESMRASGADQGSTRFQRSGSGSRLARCRTCGAAVRTDLGPCTSCGGRIDQTRAYFVGMPMPETTHVCTPPPADLDAHANLDDDDNTDVTQVDAVAPRDSAFDETWMAMIAAAQRSSRSAAELVWDSLAGEDQTAVWSPESPTDTTHTGLVDAAGPDDSNDADATGYAAATASDDDGSEYDATASTLDQPWPTYDDALADRDTAEHAIVPLRWVEARGAAPEYGVCTTSEMPPARAGLLLRLAPTGYAGSGTPIDAAVVPRGQLLDVGRACAGPWAGDPYLDALHVRLLTDADGIRVIDDGSRGGVWVRIDAPQWLRDGDAFRIGEQFFAYDGPTDDQPAQLQMIDQERRFGPTIAIDGVTVMGRVAPHVVLMHDPYVSGEHCRIVPSDDGVVLEDLGSSNGTWVRMRSGDLIPFGGVVAIGRSVYRAAAAEGEA